VVEDFAELRTYGYPDCEHVYRFHGHNIPDREFTHKYLLEQLGAEAVYGLRRMGWELENRLASGAVASEAEQAAIRDYLKNRAPIFNYMGNKGWLDAVDHLAECVLENRTPDTAGARDALAASRIGHAAIRSRKEGCPVELDATP
jgi:hypothetical protein